MKQPKVPRNVLVLPQAYLDEEGLTDFHYEPDPVRKKTPAPAFADREVEVPAWLLEKAKAAKSGPRGGR